MPSLPSSLALANVADGSLIIASDHRNNYSAIQTAVNALITALSNGTAGQVLDALSSSSVGYADSIGKELGYTQITANANITDTVESTATALISAPSISVDGSTAVLVEFYSPLIVSPSNAAADATRITLWDGATEVGRIAQVQCQVAGVTMQAPARATYKSTPAAGTRNYKICGFVPNTTGTPTIVAGAGGTGAYVPAFIRVTKA